MSSAEAPPILGGSKNRFRPDDLAFARAWEIYAPGLSGWTVQLEDAEDGSEWLMVDPPLVYGEGFVVTPEGSDALVTWPTGARRMPSLREAMLLICPLSPEALAAAEQLALAPDPEI